MIVTTLTGWAWHGSAWVTGVLCCASLSQLRSTCSVTRLGWKRAVSMRYGRGELQRSLTLPVISSKSVTHADRMVIDMPNEARASPARHDTETQSATAIQAMVAR